MTTRHHGGRSARVQASFFIPFLRPGMRLLDCGCGAGSITLGLAKIVAPGQVTGIDRAEVEIERARARLAADGATNVVYDVGDVYQLAYPDGTFDAVFSHNVLEHLSDPELALGEMKRVLRPGGLIGVRDFDIGGNLYQPDALWYRQWHTIYEADWRRVCGDPRMGRRLKGLLDRAGFVDIRASASYDVYGDPEAVRFLGEIGAARFAEPDFVRRVVAAGLATHATLEDIRSHMRAWAERADAFAALAHGEAVATRPLEDQGLSYTRTDPQKVRCANVQPSEL
jgi:ubiquinone/menaquinone biosynthesis C-methylase UbiE